jgi:3-deoxy-D-manno-octulosonic-acid transferase
LLPGKVTQWLWFPKIYFFAFISMDKIFYIFFVTLYTPAAKILSLFNPKAGLWLEGRKNIFEKIATALANDKARKIWMHCASLGEFEQGRPLLEKMQEKYPDYKFILTFFSPSGYEVQKNSGNADYIFYLPVDSKKNAKIFFDLVQPGLIFIIKYDYWYYFLKEAHNRKIPVLLVSGIFLPTYSFFQWYGKMRREMLRFFTHLFVQTKKSKELLQSIHIANASITGDTRFDRVLQVAAQQKKSSEIEQFISGKKTIVAGSTWLDDDEALDHFANTHSELRFIIAPHDIGKERIKECCKLYQHSILYSVYKNSLISGEPIPEHINTLIIDNIGMLKFLYRYADICYIGGGFGSDGIHNILEAAVYYKPVLFGPAFENFSEALDLVEKGGAFDVEDALDLENQLKNLLSNAQLYNDACQISGEYVKNNAGATAAIINYIQENRLLIN